MNQLTEAKDLFHQGMEKIKEYELLEEARRRYPKGTRYKSADNPRQKRLIEGALSIYGHDAPDDYFTITDGYGGFVYFKDVWAEIIPEEEKKKELVEEERGVTTLEWYCDEMGKLEQAVLKETAFEWNGGESLVDATIRLLSKIKFNPVQNLINTKPEKSLHDQIREGGWEKVFELINDPFGYFKHSTANEINFLCEEANKGNAYYKLRALSKVLNEGKEEKMIAFTICFGGKIKKKAIDRLSLYPIYFNTDEDTDFALDFAEKEWKIFYNAK